MVSFGLVGISLPEVGHSVIETFTLAEVGSDLTRSPERACALASAQPQILAYRANSPGVRLSIFTEPFTSRSCRT